MRIGITDNGRPNFELYIEWLRQGDPSMDFVMLSLSRENLHELQRCEGLVLTGGEDVSPTLYGRPEALSTLTDVNPKRDEFELTVIQNAMRRQLPTLAICRGMQLTNVFFGGSLIVDLESEGYANHRKSTEVERRHAIAVSPGSRLSKIVGGTSGEVNTSHHQAVRHTGIGLRASAVSPDGVVEALEWEDDTRKQFLLLIQWHPERMSDFQNPCSYNVLRAFLSSLRY